VNQTFGSKLVTQLVHLLSSHTESCGELIVVERPVVEDLEDLLALAHGFALPNL
jgi:hypothetical protein